MEEKTEQENPISRIRELLKSMSVTVADEEEEELQAKARKVYEEQKKRGLFKE